MTNRKTAETFERTLTAEIKLCYDVIAATSRPAPLLIAPHGCSKKPPFSASVVV